MPARLTTHSYGKSAIRLTKILRHPTHHDLLELDVAIELTGDFDASYVTGDNTKVIPTDTMKNTVYALAASHSFASPEEFAGILAAHFAEKFTHVTTADIRITQSSWNRLNDHTHTFTAGAHKRFARVAIQRGHRFVSGGVRDLVIIKTTDSAFKDFLRDPFTTLKDTDDRIFATSLEATWYLPDAPADFNAIYDTALSKMLDVFAHHKSLAVQQTLHAMGQAAMEACPQIQGMDLAMPNQHRIPFNLEPLGLENKNEIFITTSEPYGLIKASMRR